MQLQFNLIKIIHRDIALELIDYKLLTASAGDQLKLWVLLNPTTSAPLTYSAGNGSIEYAAGNGTISGFGTVLSVAYSTQVSSMETQTLQDNFLTWLGSTLNNTMDTIVLAGTPITATIATHSSLTVKEY